MSHPTIAEQEMSAADRTTAELFDDVEQIDSAIDDAAEEGRSTRRLDESWKVAMRELKSRGNILGFDNGELERDAT